MKTVSEFTAEHPVTLFTGQWADLPFEEVAKLAAGWGYDGLEIAASGDHLDLERADQDDAYLASGLEILERNNLRAFAISNHLTGQAVCDDPIDFRHKAIVRSSTWGDGDPEGVRQRAAEDMKRSARVARKLGVDVVVGFTGSKIWPYVAQFPPVSPSVIEEGFEDFAARWNPILDVFDAEGVRFAHEVHPSEIAYDYWSSVRALEAIDHRSAFGFNWDPSHMMWQNIDPVGFIVDFKDRIYHVDCKDTRLRPSNGRARSPGFASALGRPASWVGFRLDRTRGRALGGRLPRARIDRVFGANFDRVGRRRYGSFAWCGRGNPVRAVASVAASRVVFRLGLCQPIAGSLSTRRRQGDRAIRARS